MWATSSVGYEKHITTYLYHFKNKKTAPMFTLIMEIFKKKNLQINNIIRTPNLKFICSSAWYNNALEKKFYYFKKK